MPLIYQHNNMRVLMFYGDHPPPHVHVRMRDSRECIIEINTLEITGSIPFHELNVIILWIKNNKSNLLSHWGILNNG